MTFIVFTFAEFVHNYLVVVGVPSSGVRKMYRLQNEFVITSERCLFQFGFKNKIIRILVCLTTK